jgi:hypothetical protein
VEGESTLSSWWSKGDDAKKSFHSQECHYSHRCQKSKIRKITTESKSTMPLSSRPTPMPMPPQPRSVQPQTSGLSLLDNYDDDDRLSNEEPPEPIAASNDNNEDKSRACLSLDSSSSNTVAGSPYEFILEQARAAKLELETVRDELYWLQVSNCRTLDALCMVGSGGGGVALDDDGADEHVGSD